MHWAPCQVLGSQGPGQVRCSQGICIFKDVELHLQAMQQAFLSREGQKERESTEHCRGMGVFKGLQACKGLLARGSYAEARSELQAIIASMAVVPVIIRQTG